MQSGNVQKRNKKKIDELKEKNTNAHKLGVPKPHGEIVIITDASDVGGGATVFQWQSLDPQDIPTKFATSGVKTDGTFLHNYAKISDWSPLFITSGNGMIPARIISLMNKSFCQVF